MAGGALRCAVAMRCPDPERLFALVDGALAPDEREPVARHADDCEMCRAALVDLFQRRRSDPATTETAAAAGPAPAPALAPALAPGAELDRYVIDGVLGAGAMGVVYAARDPQLDRAIAIKVLRTGDDDEALRTRLYREAQALARVDHANVVSVFDVGTHAGQVFVAMELVRGETLRAYLTAPRTEAEILAMLVAAGRGLAAAHAAGLVHRDFKPDNVLVGDDGVARVTDFGLARVSDRPDDDVAGGAGPESGPTGASSGGSGAAVAGGPGPESGPTGHPAGGSGAAVAAPALRTGSPLDATLTATGSLLGTPVYAAPEQLAGDRAGPLADQYSFCVTVYEAFAGVRPFRGATLDELLRAIASGAIAPPVRGRKVPPRILRALLRGLAIDPAARFPSMAALLAALAPPPRRWPWIAAAAGAVAIAAAGAVVVARGTDAPRCRSAEERLAGVWDAPRRAAVVAGLAGLAGYADAGPRLAAQLDGHAARWRAGWAAACSATEQSSTMFDLRIACLDRVRSQLDAVAGSLAAADRELASRAFDVIDGLDPVEACADTAALASHTPPPPDKRAAVDEIEAAIATARALATSRRFEPARATIEPAVARARALGFPPVLAAALAELGRIDRLEARLADAETVLRESSNLAMAGNDRRLVGEVLLELADVRMDQGDLDGAADTLELVAGTIAALDAAGGALELDYLRSLAIVRSRQARPTEALALLDRAQAVLDAMPDQDPLVLLSVVASRADVMDSLGRHAEAQPLFDRALAIGTEVAGADHPLTAMVAGQAAIALASDRTRYAEAIERVQRAYDVLVRTRGADAPETIELEDALANIAVAFGDYDTAFARFGHILELANQSDPRSYQALTTRASLGEAMVRAGKLEAAIEHCVALRRDADAVAGAASPIGALADDMQAEAQLALGRADQAFALFDAADQLFAAQVGDDHPVRAFSRGGRGRALLAQGKVAAALVDLRAAAVLLERDADPFRAAQNKLAIADALWRTGDRDGARASATAAIGELDALSPRSSPGLRREIEAWRRTHP
jgi:serine/threonine protein kinase/tetratricopeptide (TPR) repeat protein